MKRIRIFVSIVLASLLLFSVLPSYALAANVGNQSITSAGAFVMDFETGVELYGYKADVKRVPASMTKLLAVYVVYDAVKRGDISLDTVTSIKSDASAFSYNREYSNVPLPKGYSITIDLLLDFVIVYSACAATVSLGDAVFGSEAAMVEKMNEKVKQLGIDAVFYDCYGGSSKNNISPRGIAELSRNLIMDHPEILEKTSKSSVTFQNVTYKNTNTMLSTYPGIDGLKTGMTNAAGYCFTGTAVRNGRRIISVTMGSSGVGTRFPDTAVLLDYGFLVADELVSDYLKDKRRPSSSTIVINGEAVPVTAYLINDNHFFKLRDIAFLLSGTGNQFEVIWDDDTKSVHMTSDMPYTPVGNELEKCSDTYHTFSPIAFSIFLDEEERSFDAYTIDGYNYVKLRDIAELIGFSVDWDGETQMVLIETVAVESENPDEITENPDSVTDPNGTDTAPSDDDTEKPEDNEVSGETGDVSNDENAENPSGSDGNIESSLSGGQAA